MAEMEFQLDDPQRLRLLELARTVIEAEVSGKSSPKIKKIDDDVLNQPCGCFVTLHVSGKLRGCIGSFKSNNALWQTVMEMSKAALQDPRFRDQPISADELEKVDVEISALSPLELTDDPLHLFLPMATIERLVGGAGASR